MFPAKYRLAICAAVAVQRRSVASHSAGRRTLTDDGARVSSSPSRVIRGHFCSAATAR